MTTRNGLIGLLIAGIGVALFCGLSAAENPQFAPIPQLAPIPPTAKAADTEPATPVTTKDLAPLLSRINALENRVASLENPQAKIIWTNRQH